MGGEDFFLHSKTNVFKKIHHTMGTITYMYKFGCQGLPTLILQIELGSLTIDLSCSGMTTPETTSTTHCTLRLFPTDEQSLYFVGAPFHSCLLCVLFILSLLPNINCMKKKRVECYFLIAFTCNIDVAKPFFGFFLFYWSH